MYDRLGYVMTVCLVSVYACLYVCMSWYVCFLCLACMFSLCMCVCVYVWMHGCMDGLMCGCVYVCLYACYDDGGCVCDGDDVCM